MFDKYSTRPVSCVANEHWSALFGVSQLDLNEMVARGDVPRYVHGDDAQKYSSRCVQTLLNKESVQSISAKFVSAQGNVFEACEISEIAYSDLGSVQSIRVTYKRPNRSPPPIRLPPQPYMSVARAANGAITLPPNLANFHLPPSAAVQAQLKVASNTPLMLARPEPQDIFPDFEAFDAGSRAALAYIRAKNSAAAARATSDTPRPFDLWGPGPFGAHQAGSPFHAASDDGRRGMNDAASSSSKCSQPQMVRGALMVQPLTAEGGAVSRPTPLAAASSAAAAASSHSELNKATAGSQLTAANLKAFADDFVLAMPDLGSYQAWSNLKPSPVSDSQGGTGDFLDQFFEADLFAPAAPS
jgi:hypothetical protein